VSLLLVTLRKTKYCVFAACYIEEYEILCHCCLLHWGRRNTVSLLLVTLRKTKYCVIAACNVEGDETVCLLLVALRETKLCVCCLCHVASCATFLAAHQLLVPKVNPRRFNHPSHELTQPLWRHSLIYCLHEQFSSST